MIVYKKLNIFVGTLLVLTSITRFLQVFFDPVANTVMFLLTEDFAGDRLFSLLGGVIIGYTFYLLIAAIIGYFYCFAYFLLGISIIVLRKSRSMIKSIIAVSVISIFLEIRTLIIISRVSHANLLILFHLIVDMVIFTVGSLALIRMRRKGNMEKLKKDPYIETPVIK